MDANERAQRCAELLLADDQASRHLGIALQQMKAGSAVCTLTIMENHCNGHGVAHGGIIFSLADTTFAVACNGYNQRVVAQHNSISYLAPGKLNDVLTASATEQSRVGRSGVYDVTVTNQDNVTIALFRGCSRTISGVYFDEN